VTSALYDGKGSVALKDYESDPGFEKVLDLRRQKRRFRIRARLSSGFVVQPADLVVQVRVLVAHGRLETL
jgi:hypothetical protein